MVNQNSQMFWQISELTANKFQHLRHLRAEKSNLILKWGKKFSLKISAKEIQSKMTNDDGNNEGPSNNKIPQI